MIPSDTDVQTYSLVESQLISYPDLSSARQAGLVPEGGLEEGYLAPRCAAQPVALVGETLLWSVADMETLYTRRGWKKRHRRMFPGIKPTRTLVEHHGQIHLFAIEQTITEEDYLAQQQQKTLERMHKWEVSWQALEVELGQWVENLLQKNLKQIPEAEWEFLNLKRDRERLLEQYTDLAMRAKNLTLPFKVPDHAPWFQAIAQFRHLRLQSALVDCDPEEIPLAQQVDQELIKNEQSEADFFNLIPYWHYFGRFHKRLETVRFQNKIAQVTRIDQFHALFQARQLHRIFHLFLGPTNSGKTYQALKRLTDAPSGIYLAPLRLLALEVADTLNEWGVPCSMVTGEERILIDGAKHVACTIEMLPMYSQYEVCVIDEVQMLGDVDRGWAWTQAILGVQAPEVYVVGAPEARPAVEKLLTLTDDPVEITLFERLSPLHILRHPVEHFEQLEPETAIITFSRAGVLGLKEEMERRLKKRVAVLYGALPPEVRRQQAHLFASGQAPFLVATDAIGMGLNLPIRTLLFHQDRKFINRQEVPLTPMEVRQIAGRAGRFGKNEVGFVGTFRIAIHPITHALNTKAPPIERAHLAPNLEHLLAIATLQDKKNATLASLLALFFTSVKPDPEIFELADLEDQMVLARLADRHKSLDLATRFILSAAPVPLRAIQAVLAYETMITAVARSHPLTLAQTLTPLGEYGLLDGMETAIRIVNLYCWLHHHFEELFPDIKEAETARRELNKGIIQALQKKGKQARNCSKCGNKLPPKHTHTLCDPCWRQTQHRPSPARFIPARRRMAKRYV
ncbi:MAG: hypothetical protein H7832_07725 [Magnetococcus sp. DMHC-6]